MGCISSQDAKHPKNYKSNNKQNSKHIEPTLYKSKIGKSSVSKVLTPRTEELPSVQKVGTTPVPRIRKTTTSEFLSEYQVTSTLPQSTRLQGPKILTNKITGCVNVLRVYNPTKINEERLKKFHQLIKFDLYTDEQENYLVVDQYCSGPSICQLFEAMTEEEERQITKEEVKLRQMHVYKALLQVYDLIMMFHSNKVYLGNLNVFSFKKVSEWSEQVRLVDFCFQQEEGNNNSNGSSSQVDRMGHAHHKSFQADWQFFGYLLQFYLSSKSPVFIPHKMQYIQNDPSNTYLPLISTLLKGRQIAKKQLQQINYENLKLTNFNVSFGYRFCKDVLRLIKARKRRNKHAAVYYSRDIFQIYEKRNRKEGEGEIDEDAWKLGNFYSVEQHLILTEENLHRLQTDRILSEIQKYISKLNPSCEQHFINYSMAAENFRKLKQVFLISDEKQKLDEFKELIPQIK